MTVIATGNPITADAAGTLWTQATKPIPPSVRLIQWVDDAGDMAHDNICTLTINGVAITTKIQPLNDNLAFGAVAWQIGPFNPGILIESFVISVMTKGSLYVWVN